MNCSARRTCALVVSTLLAASPALAVTFEPAAPGVNGFTTVDRVTWKDSKGLDRAHRRRREPGRHQRSKAQGWGTNVMHMHWSQYGGSHPVFGSGFSATTSKRDGFNFSQQPVFQGAHHLIICVAYRQYTTLLKPGIARKSVQVTTDWFFADGLDAVIYAITIDATPGFATDATAFRNNTLASYSLVTAGPWNGTTDWAGGTDAPDGQSFGDLKRFTTNDMARWTYGGTNTVPFIWQWVTPASWRGDAEAAYVQTETYSQKAAGEGVAGGADARGTRLPVHPDLNGLEYSYQMNFFDAHGSKRLTWGTQQGALYGGYGSTPGFIDYSLAMHLGRFSDHGATNLLRETEAIHSGAVTAGVKVSRLSRTPSELGFVVVGSEGTHLVIGRPPCPPRRFGVYGVGSCGPGVAGLALGSDPSVEWSGCWNPAKRRFELKPADRDQLGR